MNISYYLLGVVVLAILILVLLRQIHNKNEKRVNEFKSVLTYDQVDSLLCPSLEKYNNENRVYDYVYDKTKMPLGRASAFLNFFGRSIYNEEPYLFLCRRSTNDDEFREYGCMFARTGVYFSRKLNNSSNQSKQSADSMVTFYGLMQIFRIGSYIVTINYKKGFFDKIGIIVYVNPILGQTLIEF